jgi:HAD superfamily hydrolase (TIGR01509 family)
VYQSFGFALPFSSWASMVGTTHSDFDPRGELQKLVNRNVDWERVEASRRLSENLMIEAQPILPGAVEYLRDARRMRLKIGLASNSSNQWVIRHLGRLGLLDYFDCLRTSDDVERIKPDPELYISVLHGLGVKAEHAFALEDSPVGVRSAKGAGLRCVAVPNVLTSRLDLSQADYRLGSLSDMPLEQLLKRLKAIKTQRAAA